MWPLALEKKQKNLHLKIERVFREQDGGKQSSGRRAGNSVHTCPASVLHSAHPGLHEGQHGQPLFWSLKKISQTTRKMWSWMCNTRVNRLITKRKSHPSYCIDPLLPPPCLPTTQSCQPLSGLQRRATETCCGPATSAQTSSPLSHQVQHTMRYTVNKEVCEMWGTARLCLSVESWMMDLWLLWPLCL